MKFKFVILLAFSFLFFSSAFAQSKFIESVKAESSLKYKMTHPMHEFEAESKNGYCKIEYIADKKEVKRVFVQVDVISFNSGNSNRDSHAMETVESITYPYAKFSSTAIEQSSDNLKITGKMTFHGVTNEITFNLKYSIDQDKLVVKGNFDLSLTAFKIERPSLLMVPVADDLKFTIVESFNLK